MDICRQFGLVEQTFYAWKTNTRTLCEEPASAGSGGEKSAQLRLLVAYLPRQAYSLGGPAAKSLSHAASSTGRVVPGEVSVQLPSVCLLARLRRAPRKECLNLHKFASLVEAQAVLDAWRLDYNTRPSHSLFGQGIRKRGLRCDHIPKG